MESARNRTWISLPRVIQMACSRGRGQYPTRLFIPGNWPGSRPGMKFPNKPLKTAQAPSLPLLPSSIPSHDRARSKLQCSRPPAPVLRSPIPPHFSSRAAPCARPWQPTPTAPSRATPAPPSPADSRCSQFSSPSCAAASCCKLLSLPTKLSSQQGASSSFGLPNRNTATSKLHALLHANAMHVLHPQAYIHARTHDANFTTSILPPRSLISRTNHVAVCPLAFSSYPWDSPPLSRHKQKISDSSRTTFYRRFRRRL